MNASNASAPFVPSGTKPTSQFSFFCLPSNLSTPSPNCFCAGVCIRILPSAFLIAITIPSGIVIGLASALTSTLGVSGVCGLTSGLPCLSTISLNIFCVLSSDSFTTSKNCLSASSSTDFDFKVASVV